MAVPEVVDECFGVRTELPDWAYNLISEVTGSGKRRRCDARCYNARTPKCTCICGGLHHGVGLQRALDQTRAMFQVEQPPPEAENRPAEPLGAPGTTAAAPWGTARS